MCTASKSVMKFSEALTMSVAAAVGADDTAEEFWRCELWRLGAFEVVAGRPKRMRSVALGASS